MQVRITQLLFMLTGMALLISCSNGWHTQKNDYEKVDFDALVNNTNYFDKRRISIYGKLNLSHFETAGLKDPNSKRSILIDWMCFDRHEVSQKLQDDAAKAGFDRFNRWVQSGFDNKLVEVKGVFAKEYEDGFTRGAAILDIYEMTVYDEAETGKSSVVVVEKLNCITEAP